MSGQTTLRRPTTEKKEMNFQPKDIKPVSPATNEGMNSKGILTRREKEVLKKVAEGLTTTEIAAKLYVSINTVETHRGNIIQKLRAKNIAETVAKAMRIGLIK